MARIVASPRSRALLMQMAQVWARLAEEHAYKTYKESAD